MKSQNKTKAFHTSSSPKGMGDFYGTGIKNPVGAIKRDFINGSLSPKKVKKPPKALA